MTKIKTERVERRRFLRAMTVAAGAAGFAPQFYGAAGPAATIQAEVGAAPSDSGTVPFAIRSLRSLHRVESLPKI
jgi:hypothetical protein